MQERVEKVMSAIQWIKKTKEVIDFAHQIQASITSGSIKSQDIIKEVDIGPKGDDYRIKRDWTKYPNDLKNDFANNLKINTISYQCIVLKESYAGLFKTKENPLGLFNWAKKSTEPDLWVAQQILKLIRNALGHMKAKPGEFEAQATWDFTKEEKKQPLGRLEVIGINVVLDTTNLQDVVFNWDQIGGVKNFNKILEYLVADLEKKIQ